MAENNTITTEEWRSVVGYEGHYEVSAEGRIRTVKTFHYNRTGKILKPDLSKGYFRVNLVLGDKKKHFFIHTLVAAAFIGLRPEGRFINHIDGVKTNNHPSNLEYCTPKENQEHASRMGLMSHGDSHYSRQRPECLARGERHGSKTKPEKWPRGDNHHSRLRPECLARGEKHGSKTCPEKLLKGEKNPSAKLTEIQVKEILSSFAPGYGQLVKFARLYNVHPSCIRLIVTGHNWKHLNKNGSLG